MTNYLNFKSDGIKEVLQQGADSELRDLTRDWMIAATKHKYSYHFEWLGMPIIQHPQDMIGVQQLIWDIKPDLIIETGIARGGSLIYYASILELVAKCGGEENFKVIGVDIDIREHNKKMILDHPMSRNIQMIEGSSVDKNIFDIVFESSKGYKKILVCLDSNHEHEHVLRELNIYSTLVSKGSYCIVFDTFVEDMPVEIITDRPWGKGNNPKTAVHDFLSKIKEAPIKAIDGDVLSFEIDSEMEHRLLITSAPDGFLKRI
jgi:cephalosporin hydroxylase